MKKITFESRFFEVINRPILLVICICALGLRGQQKSVGLAIEQRYDLAGTSIRAIEVDDNSNLWFAGSNGIFGRISQDELKIDSLKFRGLNPSFRALALRKGQAFAMSIESPALLYELPLPGSGLEANLVYKEEGPGVFYDSMTFLDSLRGIAMGDPIGGCLSILITHDGGSTWKKKPCSQLPKTVNGEAGFAASDTNIATFGEFIWIGTGGERARVFRSGDAGETWEAFETPLAQGETMTGIYSVAFADSKNGIAMGGNWEEKANFENTKAVTQDGGKTWTLVANGSIPGYISCVQYIPETSGRELVACSTEGIYHSGDSGLTWTKLSDQGYYSLRFESRDVLWLSRNNEIARARIKRR